ncbi:unnamed protein product [Penicillium camemberti]|uniref:Str. FM013 n=1 Tax=Penicillium camemberti (strain FM 013) TaxID=1429867 RepID=A0A0G4PVU2_PENC3|nr:unnamed protein product [Penicillium camemberti]
MVQTQSGTKDPNDHKKIDLDQPIDHHNSALAFINNYFRWRVGSSAKANLAKIQTEDIPHIKE